VRTRTDDEYLITIQQDVVITVEDLMDIMDAAGYGINGWADAILHVGEWLGDDTCEHLANGGKVKICLREPIEKGGKRSYEMDKEMLLKGIKMYLDDDDKPYEILYNNGVRTEIDTGDVDAVVADMMVQYALFGEIVFA